MKDLPLVSVVMPVFNSASFILEAVESVLGQSYSNIELIIVDDGSTDDSLERLKALKDDRMRVYRSDRNYGQAHQLNRGIDLAGSDYVAIAHSDDINSRERIEKQVTYLVDNPTIGILGTEMKYFREGGECQVMSMSADPVLVTGDFLFYCSINHPSAMFRKSRLLTLDQLYQQEFVPCEDYDLWSRAVAQGILASNIPYLGVAYRIHESQISRKKASLTEEKDRLIRDRLFRTVFPFVMEKDRYLFNFLIPASANHIVTLRELRFVSRASRSLSKEKIRNAWLWKQWVAKRLSMVLQHAPRIEFWAVAYFMLRHPGSVFRIGLSRWPGIFYRSLRTTLG